MDNKKPEPRQSIKIATILSCIILYAFGFLAIRNAVTDSNPAWGLIMTIIGWFMIALAVFAAVINMYKIFRFFFKQ